MKVFLSWSGEQSKAIATLLRDWLPSVVQAVKPWMSETDIERGAAWFSSLAKELDAGGFGISCVTRDNLESTWLHFEAGALCKTLAEARVCPYLVGVEKAQLTGPLSHFHAASANKVDTLRLVTAINGHASDSLSDERLRDAFETYWPRLEQAIAALPAGPLASVPRRSTEDMVEEVLELVRDVHRTSQTQQPTVRLPANKTFLSGMMEEYPTLFLPQRPALSPEMIAAVAEALRKRPLWQTEPEAEDGGEPLSGA